jgi:hypothetical protein
MFLNFLKHLSLSEWGDLQTFDLCDRSHFTSSRVKNIAFRIQAKPVSFKDDVCNFSVKQSVNCSIKVDGIEVPLNGDFKVNRNFVNHCKLIRKFNFSSFRKGLIRGLNDNPKLAHNYLGI